VWLDQDPLGLLVVSESGCRGLKCWVVWCDGQSLGAVEGQWKVTLLGESNPSWCIVVVGLVRVLMLVDGWGCGASSWEENAVV